MLSLIRPDAPIRDWAKVGRQLPDPASNVGFAFSTLEVAAPEDMLGAKGDDFLASAKPDEAPFAALVHQVIAQVEQGSEHVRSLDDQEGKDIATGRTVKSPEGGAESYLWQADPLGWSAERETFFHDDGAGTRVEYLRHPDDDNLEIFASQKESAPATYVVFDREQESYTVVNSEQLSAAEAAEHESNRYLIGGSAQ